MYDMIRLIGANTVDLPIEGADPSGQFVLKGADGLGPTEITVLFAESTLEKRVYQGKKAASRQPIVRVGIQPEWDEGQTASDLRRILYGLLTPRYGALVRFQLMNQGAVVAECVGHISRMEIVTFAKDPEVQITMECDYPYFLAPQSVTQEPTHHLADGSRLFEVANDGDAPAGFRAGFILRANVGNILTLSDDHPQGEKIQIEGINWVSGDIFIVDTRAGQRGVWRRPGGGAEVSVLNQLNVDVSNWFQLYGGDNTLRINTTAFDWDPANKFQHQPAYWGV